MKNEYLSEHSVNNTELEKKYNYIRPHSSLGYHPPAPDAIIMGGINEQLGENVDLKGILNNDYVSLQLDRFIGAGQ